MLLTICILLLAVLLAWPLGLWIRTAVDQEDTWCRRILHKILAFLHLPEAGMNWKSWVAAAGLFCLAGFILLFVILLAAGQSWDTALNTAISYVTNTNWQGYDPASLPWWAQTAGLAVQNFASAAVGIAVLFALVRGLTRHSTHDLGSFWSDILSLLLFVLLPVSLVLSLALSWSGVPQMPADYTESRLIEPVAVDSTGQVIPDAVIDGARVTLDGRPVPGAVVVDSQYVPAGLMASQEAIKQLGTNGGGMTQASSASPVENPSFLTSFLETLSIVLIPMALCFTFGAMVKDRRQGIALFSAMMICLVLAVLCITIPEQAALNLEGKEMRIGISGSALFTALTTAASNGSVNASLNSFTPLGAMVPLVLMQMGEVVFGGVGSGLYGMLGFVILTVFVAGLMVGRTPEYLGKKIEPAEMKMAVLIILASPVCILLGSALGTLFPPETSAQAPHAFTQILYAFTSAGANNGSAMGGLAVNTVFMNLLTGLLMLAGRFVPMYAALRMAGSLAGKRVTASSAGTLSTSGPLFVFMLVLIVVMIGALSFFPALALGPLAQYFG